MPSPSDQEPTSGPAMPSGNAAVRAGGYKPMKPRPDAEEYAPSDALKKKKLPGKVDLRQYMTKVEDQGQTMSCVANAVAGAYEYGIKRVTGRDEDVSRLFVYYNARWRANDQGEDDGCYVQNAIEGLQRFGSCPEKAWPFKKPLILKKPNRTSYQEGTKGKVSQMRKVPVKLEAWKQALAEGNPIVFGCILFDSFDDCCEKGGVVPMPSPEDVGRATHGGHSMLCVGYSDVEKVFIVRNSWGEAWGDGGYCYMPYNYLMNPKFNDGDCWIFTPPVELDPAHRPTPPDPHRPRPQPRPNDRGMRPAPPLPPVLYYILPLIEDFWFYDDTPVVNGGLGVDFEIVTYDIELYESIEIDYFEEYTVEWSSTVVEEYAEYSEYVTESRFESMEEYSIQEVAQEYTRTTGESNFSVGSAIATIGGVAAAGLVADSLLNHGENEESDSDADDAALVEAADATDEDGDDASDAGEDADIEEAADAEEEDADAGEDAETDDAEEGEEGSSDEDEEADEEEDADDEEEDDAEEENDAKEEGDDEDEGDEDEDEGDEEEDDEEESDEDEDDAEEEGDDEESSDKEEEE